MRLIGSILFCTTLNVLYADPLEQDQGTVLPAKLSSKLAAEIRASLPHYQPPSAKYEGEESETTTPAGPDLLILPKLVVKQKAPLRIVNDDLLKEAALNKRLIHEYKDSLEGLDAILNGFSLPLFAPSMQARARGAYKQRKLDRLNDLIQAISKVDNSGAELKKAANEMNRADDWQHGLVK